MVENYLSKGTSETKASSLGQRTMLPWKNKLLYQPFRCKVSPSVRIFSIVSIVCWEKSQRKEKCFGFTSWWQLQVYLNWILDLLRAQPWNSYWKCQILFGTAVLYKKLLGTYVWFTENNKSHTVYIAKPIKLEGHTERETKLVFPLHKSWKVSYRLSI